MTQEIVSDRQAVAAAGERQVGVCVLLERDEGQLPDEDCRCAESEHHYRGNIIIAIKWYNENEKKLHPVELAAMLHQRFVFIRPFLDGNGRVARLLMNLALLRNGYTIAIIPAILRHEYIYSLEAAHTRPEIFTDFVADRVIATQLDLLRLMRDENDTVNDTVKSVESPQLSKTEKAVLSAIAIHPDYSYEQLAAACGVSRPTIARTIKALQGSNIIRRIGSDKTDHWEVLNE